MESANKINTMAASAVSEDIYKGVKKNATEKSALNIGKVAVVVVAIIGFVIAINPNSSIMGLVSDAWAGLGSAFGPLVVCSLFWKRTNKWGALAGMVCGGSMVFIWKYGISTLGGAWGIYELLPAFLVAIAANIIVSLITKAPSKEITDEFDLVNQK